MKRFLLVLSLMYFVAFTSMAQNVWLNELHYDNVGTDEGEFLEIVLEDAGSYSLANFEITLYNGNDGGSYDTKTLDLFTVGTVNDNFTIFYYDYPSNGIQNGSPDGVAISYQGTLIDGQFLSYEGTMTATDGPANGVTSTDIGVSENNADIGTSLQLAGTGTAYGDFTWQGSAPETKGDLNNDQQFGTYVPDPEPTNYPTDFLAESLGMDIYLSWTDSDGEQLPSGYLILGEEVIEKDGKYYTLPVDGVPVDDDFDWSDGMVAANVDFGVGELTMPVDPNTLYLFAIFPYTNSGTYIDYKTDGTPPEQTILSNNYVVLNSEGFNLDLGTWTQYSVVGDQTWVYEPGFGLPPGCAKASGYSGGPLDNEDWLISPVMDWTNYTNVFFGFYSAANYTGPALQLLVSQDYDGSGNPNDFTWQDVTEQFAWSETAFEWTESGYVDLNDYAGEHITLAFKYSSTTSGAATWELDNLVVYGQLQSGIAEQRNTEIGLFPNPANNTITLKNETKGDLKIVGLAGHVLVNSRLSDKNAQVNVSDLARGLYIIYFRGNDNQVYTAKLLIR